MINLLIITTILGAFYVMVVFAWRHQSVLAYKRTHEVSRVNFRIPATTNDIYLAMLQTGLTIEEAHKALAEGLKVLHRGTPTVEALNRALYAAHYIKERSTSYDVRIRANQIIDLLSPPFGDEHV